MKMLRYSGLAVLVVCIAAFASGCGGGGGGGTAADDDRDVVMCTAPQVEMNGQCGDPPQTDADRIAEARRELSSILTNAQARAGVASSAAAAIRTNADATPAQITDANSESNTAQSALARIVSANTAATLATTPAEANTALTDARAAQVTLNTSASAISRIQGAVQAAANRRRQQAANEAVLTGGSSLIKHLRDNRKVYDELLPLMADTSIPNSNLGPTAAANQATFPFYLNADGTAGTVYPKPRDLDRGVLEVTITVGSTGVTSHSKTGRISGVSGRLSQGLDLKNDAGTLFANAFTDISVDTLVRSITGRVPDPNLADTTDVDESRVYQADTDYLLAGIWLDDSSASPSLQAFAYGNQPITASHDFCSAADLTDTDALNKTCSETSRLGTIAGVLTNNTDKSYTYRGNANGAYMADGKASIFKANVSLTAEFQDVAGTGSGTIGGNVTNITAGGNRIDGNIELQKQDITDGDLTAAFTNGVAAGVVGENAYQGAWKGRFFGMRYDKKVTAPRMVVDGAQDTQAISYTPGLPNSVAGTFYVNKLTGTGGNAAFIGAFGAHR